MTTLFAVLPKHGIALIVECDGVTAHETMQYMRRRLGPSAASELIVHPTDEGAAATIRLRHAGNDYAHGGTPNCKRLQVSELVDGVWTEWSDA